MTYTTVIFDLDGTAIPHRPDGVPSHKVVEAMLAAHSSLKLCAATGRAYRNSSYILHAFQLVDPCVVSGGTQIVDPTNGKILWQVNMLQADVAAALDICRPFPYEVIWRSEILGEGAPAAARVAEDGVNVMYVMACSEPDADSMLRELNRLPRIVAVPVRSWTDDGVDIHITNSSATKEHAVEVLLDMLKVKKTEVIGVGDGGNDMHLFRSVGRKVAMGNAVEELKQAADEVCASVEQDGLADVLQRYATK
ncbi:HAD hydrolase family protein [Candidatus Saccharibacteria bacterium]|nr:HAD hydrolase family protein [Candidatus Saccharibacteria bacterium]